jgi:hypothetical protein
MVLAAQSAQKFVPRKHTQDLHQSRHRSHYATLLRIDYNCHMFLSLCGYSCIDERLSACPVDNYNAISQPKANKHQSE